MSLFVIADLHLSLNAETNKSMEKFGTRWTDYVSKLEKRWRAVVNDDDSVVIPGDISWALTLDESREDFKFLESLPGTKYIGKGNHDFWWATKAKIDAFFDENDIKSIRLLHNNAYTVEDFNICGTRGWFVDQKQQNTVGDVDYQKIVNREALRLELSINEAEKLREQNGLPIIVFLHFPPFFGDFICEEIIDVLKKHSIDKCYFGHIHSNYRVPRTATYDGIDFIMASADFLDFTPMPVFPE